MAKSGEERTARCIEVKASTLQNLPTTQRKSEYRMHSKSMRSIL